MSFIFIAKSAEEAEKRIAEIERKRITFLEDPVLYDLNMEDLTSLRKDYERYIKKIQLRFECDNCEYSLTFSKKTNDDGTHYLHLKLEPAQKSKKNPPDGVNDVSNYIKRNYACKIRCNWKSGPTFHANYTAMGECPEFDVGSMVKKYQANIVLVNFKNPPDHLYEFAAEQLEQRK